MAFASEESVYRHRSSQDADDGDIDTWQRRVGFRQHHRIGNQHREGEHVSEHEETSHQEFLSVERGTVGFPHFHIYIIAYLILFVKCFKKNIELFTNSYNSAITINF